MLKISTTPSAASRKLTVLPLVAATYFMVSGGPYGLEELVQNSGYKIGLAILILTPLIWGMPTGLLVGELSAAIPADGGFYVWVRRAMGPFWGFQEAWLSLAASLFDLAAYPVAFVLSLGKIWPVAVQGHNGVMISAALIVVCVLWNLFGARAVGEGSVLMGVLLLSPFAAIMAFALFRHGSLSAATATNGVHGSWLTGVMVAMWNYMGWDNASTVAGEVENPQRTYPRVMLYAMAAIILSYALPVLAVWHTHIQPGYWTAGSWASIASLLGGPWLGIALVTAGMISTFGIVNSLTMSYSRLPMAMAEDGYAPKFFLKRLRNGAPWVSIVTCGVAWIVVLATLELNGLNLDRLLMLDILLYGASLILEFVALVLLRIREPQLHRPFKIPGGPIAAALMGVGPTAMLTVAFIKNRDEHLGSISSLALGAILMGVGVILYLVTTWVRRPAALAVGTDAKATTSAK
ncbi:MAG TPA: APC family permease [Candidatus Angelobacter sp.]|nr:APC family permease [Candidatus Angelobacter sp.]